VTRDRRFGSELASDLDRLAADIAPGLAVAVREGKERKRERQTRVVSTETRRINGRHVTVQRRRSAFAIFVDG